MSANLFPRAWAVRVDTLEVSALDLEFKILRSLKHTPNKCQLTIWNVNEEHRAQLLKVNKPGGTGGKTVGINVQVEAGYQGNTSILFSGDLRECTSTNAGLDWKTTLSGDDGGRASRESRINLQFAKGTPVGNVLTECAKALGLGLGNVADFASVAEIAGIGTALPHGMTLSGNASQALKRVCDSLAIDFSIQVGVLQLQERGKPLNLAAILLSPSTGLLGSPEASVDSTISTPSIASALAKAKKATKPKPASQGVLKAKAMLIPGLTPGRKVQLDSAAFKGNYTVTEAEYVGQSWSNTWEVNLILRAY